MSTLDMWVLGGLFLFIGILLKMLFDSIEKRQDGRHQENLVKFDAIFTKVDNVGERVAAIEGRLDATGRFPKVDR